MVSVHRDELCPSRKRALMPSSQISSPTGWVQSIYLPLVLNAHAATR